MSSIYRDCVTGPTPGAKKPAFNPKPYYLASDSSNAYYEVPIPWGITLMDGAVTTACDGAKMEPLCFEPKLSGSQVQMR